MRFSEIVNATMRFGAVFRCEPLRDGSVIFYVLGCGSVRFSDIVKPTVQCGAVIKRAKIVRCGVVRLTAQNRTEPIGKTATLRTLHFCNRRGRVKQLRNNCIHDLEKTTQN